MIFAAASVAVIFPVDWTKIFWLAVLFAGFFLTGSGYRLWIAVVRRDESRATPASWAGGVAGAALLAAGLAIAGTILAPGTGAGMAVLAAYGLAINAGYVPAKLACRKAGCCAAPRLPFDLRLAEIGVTLVLIALVLALWLMGSARAAAIAGIGGHLAVRLASYRLRHWLPSPSAALFSLMQDIVPLAALALLAGVI